MRNKLLKVETDNSVLTISIGVDALKTSIESGHIDIHTHGEVVVTDTDEFIKEFVRFLTIEAEDGTTPIHKMFDEVALEALENGAEGIVVEED